jgi:glucosamine 6-phosphate synthetase-like amidotransferase/phosphosugar isomerase protein
MCGISSSIINLNSNFDQKLYFDDVNHLIEKKRYKEALNKSKNLRNNNTFVNLICKRDQKNFLKIKKILKKCNKIKNDLNFEIIDDLIWVLNKEILQKVDKIKKILKNLNSSLEPNSVIFAYHMLSEFENINYLESRGRDSASLSINFILKKNSKLKCTNESNKLSLSINKISTNKEMLNITLKTANRVGYSGENVKNLKNTLISSDIISKINFKDLEFFSIITHTRWATVGDVNLNNCHPLIIKDKDNYNFYSMNGDITNYKKIFNKLTKKETKKIDKKCNNDLVILNSVFKKKKQKDLRGSFVIIGFDFKNPKKILIYKKGDQGLYFSRDPDNNVIISSDVYGIVNRSSKYNVIKNNVSILLDERKSLNKYFIHRTFQNTNLSSRDFDKKNHETFFQKEINDTELFIKRTTQNYVNIEKNKLKNLDLFNSVFLKKVKNKKIRNIIFTGMGSCYTAAVGISKYLLNSLKKNNILDIKVEATIASEGSGFYLSKKMDDTIIIVLAQSGTTIDTNVYAKMARKRGAYTLSIVNKKFGDVTYIVQKNLYLGNGRDVELSVPSTKTYTCHLILGYILCENILNILNITNKNFVKNLINLIKPNYISKKISKIEKKILSSKIQPINYKNWYVLYDKSSNAFNALEFRIKLSECCYRSIPYLTVNQFNKLKVKNSLVFYIGNKVPNIKTDTKNYYVFASSKKIKNNDNVLSVNISEKNTVENTLDSALSLQLISYFIAKKINNFSKNRNLINSKSIDYIYDDYELKGKLKIKNKNFISQTIEKFKRPIDTIKHQAKTITVGAIRSSHKEIMNTKLKVNNKKNHLFKDKEDFENIFEFLKEKIYIFSEEKDEIVKYYICNIIDRCNLLYNQNKKYFFVDKIKKIPKNISYVEIANSIKIDGKIKIKNINFHNILQKFLTINKFTKENEYNFSYSKSFIDKLKPKINLGKLINSFNNVKLLGSGINYLIAKKYALIFSKKFNKSIAYDVIENHKHIDISSEPLLIIFAANIFRTGFQTDVISEIEKFISHNNKIVVFTNSKNNFFDKISNKKDISLNIIKLPVVDEIYSAAQLEYYLNKNFK